MSARRRPDWMTVVILLVAAGVAAACVAIVVVSDRDAKRKSNPQIVGPMPKLEPEGPTNLRLTVPDEIAVLGPPVPQDEARQSAQRRRLRERLEKQTLAAYDSVGRRDPKWDAAARTALQGLVDYTCGGSSAIDTHHMRTAGESARAAVAAGCTDPLIRYLAVRFPYDYARAAEDPGVAPDVRARYSSLLPDLRASRYPPSRKGAAYVYAASALTHGPAQGGQREEVKGLLDESLEQAAALVDEGGQLARDDALVLCLWVSRVGRWLAEDRQVWYRQVAKALGDRSGADVVLHVLRARHLIDAAWDARGEGLASTVTEEGWRLYHERLQQAEEALEAAWAADQTCITIPVEMVTVCKGLSHDRDTMERWFRRAMEIDGDSLEACDRKLDYLQPKWGGSVEAVVGFGRQCRDTGNWTGGLPLALVHAHQMLARDLGNKREYYKQPVVRADIESVYRPLLQKFPDALAARTDFFALAVEQGWTNIAREQRAVLRDNPWKPLFDSAAQYGWYFNHDVNP
jgi:hypothetical protein